MTRTLRFALLAAVVLSIGFGDECIFGQEQEPRDETTSLPEVSQATVPHETFVRLHDMTRESLAGITAISIGRGGESERMKVATVVSPRGGELTVDGMNVHADRYVLDIATRVVEAEGHVIVTTTHEDGSTVTMRAERVTIEED